jgi:predicted O-linked N-acetylglucosamine transferase (SPINDLY family)
MSRPPRHKPRTLDIRKAIEQAFSFHREGKLREAERQYEAVLNAQPNHFDGLHLLGVVRAQQGDLDAAVELISRALDQQPHSAEALFNLGLALSKLNRYTEAMVIYDKALALNPDYTDVLYNRGNTLAALDRYQEAIEGYDEALRINPDHVDVLYNRGNALRKLNRHAEAIASYDKALNIKPDHAEVLNNRGDALQSLSQYAEAITNYDRALAIKPDLANAYYNRGTALGTLHRHEEATVSYHKALEIDPDCSYALGEAAGSRGQVCDWHDRDLQEQQLLKNVRAGKPACVPFLFLAASHSPADQLICATTFVRDRCPAGRHSLWKGERYQHDRIRVAYVSADFHEHATAYLMARLLERHDRTRFETVSVSFGPDGESEMRRRLKNAFERFIDVRQKSDFDIASLMRELEIDIAVDLKGFTTDCRTGIFALRPAPIQVNYLGYPGTMGAEYIDYIIADEFVIPRDHQVHYSEKVAYLPDCYQVNDSMRRIAEHTPTRAEVGLPERGFVFCSFNNSYKITPAVFDVWMRLLREVEGSVLWLLEANAAVARNLRREAADRGIAPERLVFAPRIKVADHLARHRLADLFLDTLPLNAHTTASDALWVGVPLVTCLGTTFAGRVAASLLNAIGLNELITHALEEYEALALELAANRKRLAEIKSKLAENRNTFPLFNTDRFRRHIEAAYTTMWERYQRGEPPESFAVEPIDR